VEGSIRPKACRHSAGAYRQAGRVCQPIERLVRRLAQRTAERMTRSPRATSLRCRKCGWNRISTSGFDIRESCTS
jgi:hypothetical protein